jgi:hypothetical protein
MSRLGIKKEVKKQRIEERKENLGAILFLKKCQKISLV